MDYIDLSTHLDTELNMAASAIHEANRKKGFYDDPKSIGDQVALMHSELSELLEVMRKDGPDAMDEKCPSYTAEEVELADLVIRALDYAGWRDLNIGGALVAKAEFNTTRPHKHGKNW